MFGNIPFGTWLKEYRSAHGLTRAELARRVGCSSEMIHKIELGQRRPSRQIAELLADAAHIGPEEREEFVEFARSSMSQGVTGIGKRSVQMPASQAQSYPTNLRTPLNRLIGREHELEVIRNLILGQSVRLLTLTGPPGIGKTRLATQVGLDMLDEFPDGVFFVPLASLTEPDMVLNTIGSTLGLQDAGYEQWVPLLVNHLRDKEALLILDNFEQVIEAGPEVVGLIESCLRLNVIVTSREPLRTRGEQRYPVPPLAVPDPAGTSSAETLARFSAVSLLVDRARAVEPDFALTDENAASIAAICAQTNGLPLTIELIAARIRMLSPQALLARMVGTHGSEQLQLLTGGALDLPARHRTVRDAITWSYNLLDEGERKLFARLGVFTGGWTLAAVEAICNAAGDLPLNILEGVSLLLDKSLLEREREPNVKFEPRFTMLEVIREYAGERLAERNEEAEIRQWHAEYYLALAETADPQLTSTEQKLWFDRLEREHDNLRSALRWSLENGEVEIAGRLSSALARFWDVHTHLAEGRFWLGRVLDTFGDRLPLKLKADVLQGAGGLAQRQGDFAQASIFLKKSLTLQRQLGDDPGAAQSLNDLGLVQLDQGDFEQAVELFRQSLLLREQLGDLSGKANTLNNYGLVELYVGNFEQAVRLFEESLRLRLEVGDNRGAAVQLCNLGEAARMQRDYERAGVLFSQALASLRDFDDKALMLGCLGGLATIAAAQGHAQRATRLFGAEESMREALGTPLPPSDQDEYDRHVATVRNHLGVETFASLWAEGRAMTQEQIIEYGLAAQAN
jgi:predicted ATPase/transcriptional regulator with XRE-family HTH domain